MTCTNCKQKDCPCFTAAKHSEAQPEGHPAVGGDKIRCGEEHYELDAYIWRRESTQSWVLEVSGCINDTTFIARHSEPLTTKPEDVALLPSLYAVGGEAVAWMIDSSDPRDRAVTADHHVVATWKSAALTVTPLYTPPPATVDVEALRKALNDIREAVTQEPEDKFGYSQVDHGSGIPRAYSVRENILYTIDRRLAALIGKEA